MKAALLVAALLLSAYLMAGAMQPGSAHALAWFTLAPLFVAIRVLSPGRALVSGALWGAGVLVFSQSAMVWSSLSSCLLVLVPAAYAWLGALLTRWIGFSPFVLGVGWMGVELALAPLGINFGLLGSTQSDIAVMQWLGRALGCIFIAFTVAYVNAMLVSLATRVSLSLPRPRPFVFSGGSFRLFEPQVFSYFFRFAVEPRQARAPPFLGTLRLGIKRLNTQ